LKEQWRSGLSVRAFCQRRGLAEPSFYFWRKEVARRDAEQARLPDQDADKRASSQSPAFAQLMVEAARTSPPWDSLACHPPLERCLLSSPLWCRCRCFAECVLPLEEAAADDSSASRCDASPASIGRRKPWRSPLSPVPVRVISDVGHQPSTAKAIEIAWPNGIALRIGPATRPKGLAPLLQRLRSIAPHAIAI
jgi:hypothetical protein